MFVLIMNERIFLFFAGYHSHRETDGLIAPADIGNGYVCEMGRLLETQDLLRHILESVSIRRQRYHAIIIGKICQHNAGNQTRGNILEHVFDIFFGINIGGDCNHAFL